MSGKGITMTVMVETYAVLALLVSFLVVNSIKTVRSVQWTHRRF